MIACSMRCPRPIPIPLLVVGFQVADLKKGSSFTGSNPLLQFSRCRPSTTFWVIICAVEKKDWKQFCTDHQDPPYQTNPIQSSSTAARDCYNFMPMHSLWREQRTIVLLFSFLSQNGHWLGHFNNIHTIATTIELKHKDIETQIIWLMSFKNWTQFNNQINIAFW